jgi:Ala-tRNA(Pro) deacylase
MFLASWIVKEEIAMPNDNRVRTLLEEEDLDYESIAHRDTYTARDEAAASHVPAREVAKAVVVRDGGGRYLMAVVPATCRLDLAALACASGHSDLVLASEEEVLRLFPDCERGPVPPFGNLYDIPTFVDACLSDMPEIFFTAGSRREVVGMRFADYERAARPMVGQFCLHGAAFTEAAGEP